jgi:hypothetical protein
MKRKIFITAVLVYILSSCSTYIPLTPASENPIAQKLPKMELEWNYGGDIQGAYNYVDYVKNIARNEINKNIIAASGVKQGSIEVYCEKLHLRENLGFAVLSGITLFTANILGMPITIANIDMTLSFNILDKTGNIIDSRKYSVHKKNAVGLYYGKPSGECLVEATKDIMQRYRDDLNSNSSNIIAKLNENNIDVELKEVLEKFEALETRVEELVKENQELKDQVEKLEENSGNYSK